MYLQINVIHFFLIQNAILHKRLNNLLMTDLEIFRVDFLRG